jgi:hypothetical protein
VEVTTLHDVIDAWTARTEAERAFREARERYRETVRAALADGVAQTAIAEALDRTRESIRQDAMTDEELAAFKQVQAERRRARRQSAG